MRSRKQDTRSTPRFGSSRPRRDKKAPDDPHIHARTVVVSLLALLLGCCWYIYTTHKGTDEASSSVLAETVDSGPPKALLDNSPHPSATDTVTLTKPIIVPRAVRGQLEQTSVEPRVLPKVTATLKPSGIHTLFVAPMDTCLDASIRAELYAQMRTHIRVVAKLEDADAVLEGLSAVTDRANDSPGGLDNDTGTLSLYDRTHGTLLWSGEANDRRGFFSFKRHGGKAKVAQRLIASLKQYLGTE
jgi:hypothetical protein